MARVLQWSFDRMVKMIVSILLNKFDAVIVIEGRRGLGKSTLAFHLAKGVSREFRKLCAFDEASVLYYYNRVKVAKGVSLEEFVKQIMVFKKNKAYYFRPKKNIVYERKDVLRFFHEWNGIGIADEMINVSFNRDFYDEEQKDLIKIINMNRDHCNLFIPCVPQFQNLDSQMKNLCKLRLTVVRRGIVVIQTPNRTIYAKDIWDAATNEKIERDWIKRGVQNPHYAKLTTFRGIMKFPPLTDKQELLYQSIKDERRNVVAREQMGIVEEEKKDDIQKTIELLSAGKIRNAQIVEGIALNLGKEPEGFKRAIANKLKKEGLPHKLTEYYWDKKGKVAPDVETDRRNSEIRKLLERVSNK